jgi:hypothetical protein
MQSSQKTQESMQRTAQTVGDTIVDVLDKLAGTKSEIKLSFQDLTLDTGVVKAKMTGSVVLQAIMAQNTQTSSGMGEQATVYNVGS